MRFILALIAVVFCWLTPLGDAEQITDMTMRSGMSLALMLIMLWLSCENWSFFIAIIELGLVLLNSFIVATWPGETWVMVNYGSIQKVAFIAELLIIMGAGSDGVRLFASDLAGHIRSIFNRHGNL